MRKQPTIPQMHPLVGPRESRALVFLPRPASKVTVLMQTTMSCSLPPEILDQIVDHLHNEPATLGACCIVSKSWVPRSRIHLFARVKFTPEFPIESWTEAFPDPSNSPAHYTRTLIVHGHQPSATAAGANAGPWIRSFHNIVHLHLDSHPLAPLHGLSSALRSLRLACPKARSSEILDFMCSFPLLEDLSLLALRCESEAGDWATPSDLPRLTGSLGLSGMVGGISPIIRRLLDLRHGLHFTTIALVWIDEADLKLAADLVSQCSGTLETLGVSEDLLDPATTLFDISAATKLKHLAFQFNQPNVQWITMALQTIDSNHLQQITLRPNAYNFRHLIQETVYQEWGDLDRLLVEFWASHSIRPTVTYDTGVGREDMRDYAPSLLPELTRRGLVDLVEDNY